MHTIVECVELDIKDVRFLTTICLLRLELSLSIIDSLFASIVLSVRSVGRQDT